MSCGIALAADPWGQVFPHVYKKLSIYVLYFIQRQVLQAKMLIRETLSVFSPFMVFSFLKKIRSSLPPLFLLSCAPFSLLRVLYILFLHSSVFLSCRVPCLNNFRGKLGQLHVSQNTDSSRLVITTYIRSTRFKSTHTTVGYRFQPKIHRSIQEF